MTATKNTEQPKVLVVEDHDDMRALIVAIYRDLGLETLQASNGAEALSLLARVAPPQLISTDLTMSPIDGRTFIKRLRQMPLVASVPVIIVSSDPFLESIAASAGADAFCVKGSGMPTQLPALIRQLLSSVVSQC